MTLLPVFLVWVWHNQRPILRLYEDTNTCEQWTMFKFSNVRTIWTCMSGTQEKIIDTGRADQKYCIVVVIITCTTVFVSIPDCNYLYLSISPVVYPHSFWREQRQRRLPRPRFWSVEAQWGALSLPPALLSQLLPCRRRAHIIHQLLLSECSLLVSTTTVTKYV